ncbi:MAG: hypothetical protein ACO3BA_01495 [Schleiferiaceae bacterium]
MPKSKPFRLRRTLIVAVLAASGIGYLIWNETQSRDDLSPEAYDFAIADTASIDRIVLWDRSPDTAVLTREAGIWLINGAYPARPDAIEVLLETLYRVRLRGFAPDAATTNILSAMATYGVHVDVFAGDQTLKSFTVGTETPDMLGTYFLRDGFGRPVAVHIPGFNGYLSSRFFLREDLWRHRILWSNQEPVQSIAITYQDSAAANFELRNSASGWMLNGSEKADGMAAQALLKAVASSQYEGVIISTDGAYGMQDSLKALPPRVLVQVERTDGSINTLKLYHIAGDPEALTDDGTPQAFDPDRFYAFLDDGRMVLVQRFGLQHLLKSSRALRASR